MNPRLHWHRSTKMLLLFLTFLWHPSYDIQKKKIYIYVYIETLCVPIIIHSSNWPFLLLVKRRNILPRILAEHSKSFLLKGLSRRFDYRMCDTWLLWYKFQFSMGLPVQSLNERFLIIRGSRILSDVLKWLMIERKNFRDLNIRANIKVKNSFLWFKVESVVKANLF